MSQGMTEGQKARTRIYLDEFKENNGGCIICGRKISEWCFDPTISPSDGKPELTMYGSCAGHYMVSNSDEILEKAVSELTSTAKDGPCEKPTLIIISFKDNGEELKYTKKESK